MLGSAIVSPGRATDRDTETDRAGLRLGVGIRGATSPLLRRGSRHECPHPRDPEIPDNAAIRGSVLVVRFITKTNPKPLK
jgi:hypothetical protein